MSRSKTDVSARAAQKQARKPVIGSCGDPVVRVLVVKVKGRRLFEWYCEKHGRLAA